jgi:hypothetical protein
MKRGVDQDANTTETPTKRRKIEELAIAEIDELWIPDDVLLCILQLLPRCVLSVCGQVSQYAIIGAFLTNKNLEKSVSNKFQGLDPCRVRAVQYTR